MSVSIDGFVGGVDADPMWALRASTPDSAGWVAETVEGAGIHLLGRGSFESLMAFYPTATIPVAAGMNNIPKAVVTRQAAFDPVSLAAGIEDPAIRQSWADTRVLTGDLADDVAALKAEDGSYILAQGGTTLGRSLVRSGLVDEYRLVVAPIALGHGDGLFSELSVELDLQLIESTSFHGGVLANTYRPKR